MKSSMDAAVVRLRRFNRFFTQNIGLLDRQLLGSSLNMAQGRVLFEIHQNPGVTASDLAKRLDMDKGYLSRLLASLVKKLLVYREHGCSGRRAVPLNLTVRGEILMRELEAEANAQAKKLLGGLSLAEQEQLVEALDTVERLLTPAREKRRSELVIRSARSGEMGWVLNRHAAFYGREYGFNEDFERYVLLGMADYCAQDAACRSRLWIAELDGEPVGSVGVVEVGESRAQMRWLLVEPAAQGMGAGRALAQHAVNFCREQGFDAVFLWTVEPLHAAKSMYSKMGFAMVETKNGVMGGEPILEERWELDLTGAQRS